MAEELDIRREVSGHGGRYSTLVDGHESELTYRSGGPGRIVITHTGVPRALSGRGVGKALLARAIEDAQAEGMKIVPACSFAAVHMARRPDWQEMVAG